MNLGEVDVHFLASMNARYLSTVNNWQAQLGGKQAIYAGFHGAGINKCVNASHAGSGGLGRFGVVHWIETDVNE